MSIPDDVWHLVFARATLAMVLISFLLLTSLDLISWLYQQKFATSYRLLLCSQLP
jgi:hypothetical protein